MHVKRVTLESDRYPTTDCYPFNTRLLQQTREIAFGSNIAFFAGENGTGKSTLLEAISHRCGIHIWRDSERRRYQHNRYEQSLRDFITVDWSDGPVPGSFFGAEVFRNFAQILDEWAAADPGQLEYFGGQSLITQSHGQSLLSFFRARYAIRGVYLLDEPESALSPASQLALLDILRDALRRGNAQFVVATHSPILLACPGAEIHSFDHVPVQRVHYEQTNHYRLYRDFLNNRQKYVGSG